ncbi:MAG: hypothetical protein LBH59_10055 [Planctomycetaceae bacterium]|nr:hypothetical protein [Planctomycetaceae bacterium]
MLKYLPIYKKFSTIPKPVWAVGFVLEQTLHVVALAVFSFKNNITLRIFFYR